MKQLAAALLAAYALSAAAQSAPQAEQALPAAEPPPPFETPAAPVLTDAIIKKAVRETIAEDPHPPPVVNPQAGVLRANAVESRMSAAFEQAKVPSCLHDDALKLQPATIGPINIVGPLSLPWIISAAVRGKCH